MTQRQVPARQCVDSNLCESQVHKVSRKDTSAPSVLPDVCMSNNMEPSARVPGKCLWQGSKKLAGPVLDATPMQKPRECDQMPRLPRKAARVKSQTKHTTRASPAP